MLFARPLSRWMSEKVRRLVGRQDRDEELCRAVDGLGARDGRARRPPVGSGGSVGCRNQFRIMEHKFHAECRIVVTPGQPRWHHPTRPEGRAVFVNKMPRYEILSEDAMATLDKGWKRILTEIGIEFMKPEALDLFRAAGQKVVDDNVFLDPDFVLEQVAKAPREFDMQARNHANDVHIGGDHMVFSSVYGSPFVREGDVRRDGTMEDFRNFCKLAQSLHGDGQRRRRRRRAERRAARLPSPRHGLHAR